MASPDRLTTYEEAIWCKNLDLLPDAVRDAGSKVGLLLNVRQGWSPEAFSFEHLRPPVTLIRFAYRTTTPPTIERKKFWGLGGTSKILNLPETIESGIVKYDLNRPSYHGSYLNNRSVIIDEEDIEKLLKASPFRSRYGIDLASAFPFYFYERDNSGYLKIAGEDPNRVVIQISLEDLLDEAKVKAGVRKGGIEELEKRYNEQEQERMELFREFQLLNTEPELDYERKWRETCDKLSENPTLAKVMQGVPLF